MIPNIELPFPPSANTYYRSIRMGQSCRVIMSKKGREFKQEVCLLLADALESPEFADFEFPLKQRLAVTVFLHAPNRRKYDIDNRAKALLDSLEDALLFEDDEQIDSLCLRRGEIIKGGKSIVHIIPLADIIIPIIPLADKEQP